MMASALRKLFRSDKEKKKSKGGESPSKQPRAVSAARRLFGRRPESPSRRDYKVSPAEPPKPPAPSNGPLSENVAKHNQAVRARRLMREYREICRGTAGMEKPPFAVELVNDSLFEWNVRLFQVDPESDLYRDMVDTRTSCILLNLTFPDNFPFAPPFMRVISPHIEKGFVMEGGAICMELLTPRGWASAYTVEAVVMQFAASLIKGQGRIARSAAGKEFSRKLAEASFRSLVKTHDKYGWVTPPLTDG
ncbi:UBE2QL1 [Cordylochernes scorpioides]|uniref:UBE2QL1 n=1 Tax=Cordylochernes scorpioides TaxID=51811 RepID=A0ABY6KBJ8_9ARAC|nr:UBE2QL1 [Cordylochernes scorpioides]